MPDETTIDQIRANRDAALQSLNLAQDALSDEIASTTQTGPYLTSLTQRYRDVIAERAAIYEAATEQALALPSVIAAAATLNDLSKQMQDTAAELPDATKVLTTATTILSLGQQFANTIAGAQKG